MKFLEPMRKPKVIYTDNFLEWGTERSGVSVTNWQGFWWEGGMRSYVQISCPLAILDRMFLREFLKDGRVLRPSHRKLA